MSVLLVVGSKCMLAASHAASCLVTLSMTTEQTITLCFPPDAASILNSTQLYCNIFTAELLNIQAIGLNMHENQYK